MANVKIISNPYEQKVSFATLNTLKEEWESVNCWNNPGSQLIKEDIQKEFFPYKIKEILNIIKSEYASDNETIHIIFEGTADEFSELEEASKGMDSIEVQRAAVGIENARDILPSIVEIFSKIQPIVEANITSEDKKEEINRDIAKFIDASNDIIPICVLGNYSSGKSTFINALIGKEILPSGDLPVTAKIYRIKQAKEQDFASIHFEFENKVVAIDFKGNDCSAKCEEESELFSELKRIQEKRKNSPLELCVNQCLDAINREREGVSDLIDIEISFAPGPLKDAKNTFVVFDTPGSNTATYKEHFSILEGAMKNLSNGIPIFVAEYSSLDTCDNENLYKSIDRLNQIDDRFTMIIVNKADSANIKEKEFDQFAEEDILRQAVPSNLYSGGIYFVSSIMGLGAKKKGDLIDNYVAEFYEGNVVKYSDPSSRWYKTLYKYNIMPEQIKQRIVDESESAEDQIFANSGLLAVEHEIVNFAEKYSAYDKCKQSDKYVDKIVDATQEEIKHAKDEREKAKKKLKDQLEEDKNELINSVEQTSEDLTNGYSNAYDMKMDDCLKSVWFIYSNERVKEIESNIMKMKQDSHEYAQKKDDIKKSGSAILENFSNLGKQGITEIFKGVGEDIKTTFENTQKLREARVEADKETADELIRVMTLDYNNRIEKATKDIEDFSKKLWEKHADDTKDTLLRIVAESTSIDDDKKKELSSIILTYEPVRFDDIHVFEKADFEKKLWLLGQVVYLNKINTKKLTDTYNTDYSDAVERVYGKLKEDHAKSFRRWRDRLVTLLRNNIVNYSPKLSVLAKKIEEETNEINELERTESTLTKYSDEINKLMDWKSLA